MAFHQSAEYSPSNKNYAIEVSVFKCGENEEKGGATFFIAYGDILFENNNITNNKCKTVSSIFIGLLGSSGTCNFSTFRENSQTKSQSLAFIDNELFTQIVSYCNVIGNKCGTDIDQVLFFCWYTVNVDHCIFLKNIAKYMFQQDKDSILTISDSYVESNSTKGQGVVEFTNIIGNYDFNTFTHFFTENCYINAEKIVSNSISYLSKFTKTAAAGLFSSKK